MNWIQSQFENNEIFGGVVGAGVIGGIWLFLKTWGFRLARFIKGQFCVQITIRSEDEIFNLCQEWLEHTSYMRKWCRRVQLVSKYSEGSDDARRYMMAPAEGLHWIIFKKRLMQVNRDVTIKDNSWEIKGNFVITCFGRDRTILQEFLEEISRPRSDNVVNIYTWTGGWWRKQRQRMGRLRSTLFLDPGIESTIFKDLEWFLAARKYYRERGIPYHRGYLLSGPPGTGKTTLAVALATEFNLTMRYMSLNSFNGDQELVNAITTCAPGSLILMEDVDAAQSSKKRKPRKKVKKEDSVGPPAEKEPEGITTSGLLNALDGVIYPEGSIFVMTTNHPDKLDSALTRSGRVDLHLKLDYPSSDVVLSMAEKFYGYVPEWLESKLRREGKEKSQADWQQIFTRRMNDEHQTRKCRVCGCTDDDCLGCIARTGQPCHWVETDLCSACVTNGRQEPARR